jgi:hypothetical protein
LAEIVSSWLSRAAFSTKSRKVGVGCKRHEDLNLFLHRLKVLGRNFATSKPIQLCLIDILTLVLKIVGILIKNIEEKENVRALERIPEICVR